MSKLKGSCNRALRCMVVAVLALMVALTGLTPKAAFADEQAVREARNGVLKINWFVDGEGYSRGSCFLINKNTVLTCYHCTMFSEKELKALGVSAMDITEFRKHCTYSVNINRDVQVGATLVNYSEDQDFAILKLDQKIDGYTPLKFRSSSEVELAEKVWSLGYPANSDNKVINDYTTDDVTVKTGAISKTEGIFEFLTSTTDLEAFSVRGYFLQTDVPISSGDSGGPMVDENGNVIGICESSDTSYYYCVASDKVMEVLKTLRIKFSDASASSSDSGSATDEGGTEQTQTTPPVESTTFEVDYEDLEDAIKQAEKVSPDAYTEASYKVLTSALSDAKDAADLKLDDPADEAAYNKIQEQVNEAAEDLNDAYDKLEAKPSGPNMGLIGGIAAAAVAAIAALAFALTRKKKPEATVAPQQVAPQPAPQPAAPRPAAKAAAATAAETTVFGDDDSSTTVLGDEESATTVLSEEINGGKLTRMSNNEVIQISRSEMSLGRERRSVDYCLEGNSNIGRVHARILVRDGVVYLVDNNSTNGTYVNNTKLRPGLEQQLKSGDIIRLADEKFRYDK